MEADTVEIKNEPRCESDPKISDGIDHSGLLFTQNLWSVEFLKVEQYFEM